jgi:hypothetical protein
VLAYFDHSSGTHLDDLVIEAHLATSSQKDVNLFYFGMIMPIGIFLTWNEGIDSETDVLVIEFMIDNSATFTSVVFTPPTRVVTPLFEGSHIDYFVFTHVTTSFCEDYFLSEMYSPTGRCISTTQWTVKLVFLHE